MVCTNTSAELIPVPLLLLPLLLHFVQKMTEPPKRLRAACEAKNLSEKDFGICNIGETVRCRPQ